MPSICLGKIDGNGAIYHIALSRKIPCKPASHGRRNPHQLRIHVCGRRDTIGNMG